MNGLRLIEKLVPQCSRWACAQADHPMRVMDAELRNHQAITQFYTKHFVACGLDPPESYIPITQVECHALSLWRALKEMP